MINVLTRDPTFKSEWSQIGQSADPVYYISFMASVRGDDPDDPRLYEQPFLLLDTKPGERVLEVGCGTGCVMRALARATPGVGKVIGVDNSEAMLAEARRLSEGTSGSLLEYHLGDAHHLPFDEGSFDAGYSIGFLEIASDPDAVIAELSRVVRPGGRIVLSAPDGPVGVSLIDSSDRVTTRRILDYVTDHEMNGWLGRELLARMKAAGLVELTPIPEVIVRTDFEWVYQFWLKTYVSRAVAAGAVPAADAAAWLTDLEERASAGRFLSASTTFHVSGYKPPAG